MKRKSKKKLAIKWKKDKKKQNQAKIYTFATIILIYHRMRLHVIC